MKRVLIFLFSLPLQCILGYSQETDSLGRERLGYSSDQHLSILVGYNGFGTHFGELGIALDEEGKAGHHPHAGAVFVSSEILLSDRLIIGPKVGAWFGGGYAVGMSAVAYTDMDQWTFRVRPEFGTGLGPFKFTYGYNFALSNKDFEGINKHNFSLAYLIRLKTLRQVRKY